MCGALIIVIDRAFDGGVEGRKEECKKALCFVFVVDG